MVISRWNQSTFFYLICVSSNFWLILLIFAKSIVYLNRLEFEVAVKDSNFPSAFRLIIMPFK